MEFLINTFVESRSGGDTRLRRKLCGRLSGVIGIVLNLALGGMKLAVGAVTGSVAVTADAVNNLSDAVSSAITIVGFTLASRKSDKGRPFGYARIEYMTGIIVSVLIMVIGIQLIVASYGRIVDPSEVESGAAVVALLGAAVIVKIWLWRFNISLSLHIGSASLKATGVDSRNDAITTIGVLASLFVERFAGFHVDGFVGAAIGVFIVYSGLSMVKETAAPLLGQSPDPGLVRELRKLILMHEEALGIHDLILHDYGPGHIFASAHIEVDSRADIFLSHAMVDQIEQEAYESLGIVLVGHMDPLDTQNPKEEDLRLLITSAIESVKGAESIHDLRIVPGPDRVNVIFDVVVAHENADEAFVAVKHAAQAALSAHIPKHVVVANRDLDYTTAQTTKA